MTNSTPLTSAREELATRKADAERADKLGVVIGGSLSEGLAVKLDRDVALEELAVGRYVVARGRRARFFCMITDVALDSTNPLIAKQPPDMSDPFLAAGLPGHDHLRHGAPQPAADPGRRQGRAEAGQDRAGALHAGLHRQPGRGRPGLRRGGRAAGRRHGRRTTSTSARRWTWRASRSP